MTIPVVFSLVALILIVVGILSLVFWKARRRADPVHTFPLNKKAFFIQWITGIVMSLLGAFFMFDGDILGETTTDIARIVGIIGIGLIASASMTSRAFRRKQD